MKYKVVDYVSDIQEVTYGTCEFCFGTGLAERGYLVVEDENGRKEEISLSEYEWGDWYEIYIDNVVNFSYWLSQRDEPPFEEIKDLFSWLNKLVKEYDEENEDE